LAVLGTVTGHCFSPAYVLFALKQKWLFMVLDLIGLKDNLYGNDHN